MKIGTFGIAAGALALGLAAWITPVSAQGPLWDVVKVNMPYTITIGQKVLQPGDYTIQQMHDLGGGSRVLLIYSDNGMKFETSAMTIPVLDPNTARDTKVVLHHFGPDYYFDKIWIQGKDYGYEFPLPNSVKERQREAMEPVSVAANYSTMPAQETTQTATTTQQTTTAAQQPTTAAQQPTTAAEQQQTTVAQATVPPATTAPTTEPSANREETPAPAPRSMPHTSAGWLMMLLTGGGLSSAGLLLRRK
jgi:hypothetical protein